MGTRPGVYKEAAYLAAPLGLAAFVLAFIAQDVAALAGIAAVIIGGIVLVATKGPNRLLRLLAIVAVAAGGAAVLITIF